MAAIYPHFLKPPSPRCFPAAASQSHFRRRKGKKNALALILFRPSFFAFPPVTMHRRFSFFHIICSKRGRRIGKGAGSRSDAPLRRLQPYCGDRLVGPRARCRVGAHNTTQEEEKNKYKTSQSKHCRVAKKRGTSTFGAPMGATDDRGERIQMKKSNASPALVMVR